MSVIVHLILFFGSFVTIALIILIALVDAMSRAEFLQTNLPGILKFAHNKKARLLLLVITILLQVALGYELYTKDAPVAPEAPHFTFRYPSPPDVVFELTKEKPPKMFANVQMIEGVSSPALPKRKLFMLVGITNRVMSPVDVSVDCNYDFTALAPPVVMTPDSGPNEIKRFERPNAHLMRLRMSVPAWGPDTPLEVPIMVDAYSETMPVDCIVKPQ